jgi:crotonobetainyl-CoA:carnitine CoA-transferase CaiB-like acyl-CoA transferase
MMHGGDARSGGGERERLHGLRDLRVVDLSSGIAGAYATKLFADAYADVVKVEPPGGDPLRRRSATGADLRGEDGAFFRFLHGGKRSVVGDLDAAEVKSLIASADLVVESFAPNRFDARALTARHPGLVVLSITPAGREGPWSELPWSEFTLQAASGAIGRKGIPGMEPFQSGARITEWVGGTYAAVAALAAVARARRTGHGEHVDFSLLEAITLAGGAYMDLVARLVGGQDFSRLPLSLETPSIEPTSDGYVGFTTNSRQQISDFMVLIERPDLCDDEELAQAFGRIARYAEWNEIVHEWTRRHTTAEVLERAAALRIPVAPVLNGDTVRRHEQIVARGALEPDPTGTFLQPRRPYRFDDRDPLPPRPAPRLGEHTGRIEARAPQRPEPSGERDLPLAGIRIVDMTAWWAGPSSTGVLAALGADVIHVESAARPDGIRHTGGMARHRFPDWWEAGAFFVAANTNKRGLTLDLRNPRGLALLKRLIALSDGVIENFTPRVLENFGLSWPVIREVNPRAIMVRMPAFGLSGPWRDHTGFAQTMEQLTGLAWVTGHPHDQPRIQQGPCDPLAGMHGAWAFLVALAEREASGRGAHVESTMVEAALNAASEQLIELTAYGRLLERMGNRSPAAAPQGLYPAAGSTPGREHWLALSVESDEQWRALVRVLGDPAWARAAELASFAGRREAHDAIDERLRAWVAAGDRDARLAALLAAGVPAAAIADPRRASECPQHRARGFFEEIERAVIGRHPTPTVPFRYASVARWLERPAPTLGEHNREILGGLLGLSDEEIAALEAEQVIGTRPPVH